MTFSSCNVATEFTCNNGQCISIYQRCDGSNNCYDNSDEVDCKQFMFNGPYHKDIPPSETNPKTDKKETKVHVKTEIAGIDKVNAIAGNTELTYIITLSWVDSQVTYLNLLDKENVSSSVKDLSTAKGLIWTPISKLIHPNSIIGTLFFEEDKELKVSLLNSPTTVNKGKISDNSIEEAQYGGEKGTLSINLKLRGTYNCRFDLFRFPFDVQLCSYKLMLKDVSHRHVQLISTSSSVMFTGDDVLEDFKVIGLNSCSEDMEHGSIYIFQIKFEHLYYQQLSTTYFLVFLMWSLAYLTFFIDVNDFDNRFMGSVTALLVLSALMDSLNQRLPSSGDMKLIDVWNIWYVCQLVLINVVHVVISRGSKVQQVLVQSSNSFQFRKDMNNMNSFRMNTIAICVFPFINLIFILCYIAVNILYREVHHADEC